MRYRSAQKMKKYPHSPMQGLFERFAIFFSKFRSVTPMIENGCISDDRLRKLLPRMSISGLHVLDVIEAHPEGVKGIDIARMLGITKGTVSKITRKLLEQGLIRKTQRPDNLKEIYFLATPLGAELAGLHRLFHEEQDKKAVELLSGYDAAALEIVADFLEKLAALRQAEETEED